MEARNTRQLLLSGELIRVAGELDAREVPYISFKGPVLALICYGHVAGRDYTDLDLLVPRASVESVIDCLEGAGYALTRPSDGRFLRHFLRSHNAVSLKHRVSGLGIDLHWDLFPPAWSVDMDLPGLRARRTSIRVGSRDVSTFCPTDLAHFLALHGTKHLWVREEWIRSFAKLLDPGCAFGPVDFEALRHRAERAGTRRMVSSAFMVVERMSGTTVPWIFGADARDKGIVSFVEHVVANVGTVPLKNALFRRDFAALRDNVGDRLTHLVRTMLVPTRADYRTLGRPWLPYAAYVVERPLRLALKAVFPG